MVETMDFHGADHGFSRWRPTAGIDRAIEKYLLRHVHFFLEVEFGFRAIFRVSGWFQTVLDKRFFAGGNC